MLTSKARQPALSLLAAVFMFFVLSPVQAFDYQQCVQDTKSRSPGIKSQHVNAACSAKARNSGQDSAVSRATLGMASAYRASALLNNSDFAGLMDIYRRSASYRRHLTRALRDQFNAGQFRISIFSSASPRCQTGYTAMRSTQGLGVTHYYYRRTNPYQHDFETMKRLNLKAALCAKR